MKDKKYIDLLEAVKILEGNKDKIMALYAAYLILTCYCAYLESPIAFLETLNKFNESKSRY